MLTIWNRTSAKSCDGIRRRDFLRVGGLGAAGLSLADLCRLHAGTGTELPKHKAVIMILLGGGPSHIDMYDLKPSAPVDMRGEFKPIKTNVPGFEICELMPEQAKIADKLAVVRNLQMSTSSHNSQEVTSGFLWDRKIPGARGGPRPAFGSVISKLKGDGSSPPFVNVHSGKPDEAEDPAYLGSTHRPFFLKGPGIDNLGLAKDMTLDRLEERKQLLRSFDGLRRELETTDELSSIDANTRRALEMITSARVRDAFDVNREPLQNRVRYGLTPDLRTYDSKYGIWKQFLLARRLVEAGVSMVSLQAYGQWDTHENNFPRLREMVPVVDRGVAALVSDLYERGLDKDVCVLMWGEFGRGPRIYALSNGKVPGRDHHGPANFALFSGGGLRTGQVVGATDERGALPKGTPYRPQNVLATLYRSMGIDPCRTLLDNGRPMYLLDDREPIREL